MAALLSSFRSFLHARPLFPARPFVVPPTTLRSPFSLSHAHRSHFFTAHPPSPPLKSSVLLNIRLFHSSSRQSHRPYLKPSSRSPSPSGEWNVVNILFYGIIGANVAVFAMWKMAYNKASMDKDYSSLIWMRDNFLYGWRNVTAGRIWTIFTASFSHQDFGHILTNMFTFYFMARPVLELLRPQRFLVLYLGGGLMCCMASTAYNVLMSRPDGFSLGASGAVYSVMAFFACAAPNATFSLYGIIPIRAWIAVLGIFGYDTYRTMTGQQGTTNTVGHIGGLLTGACYFLTRRYRIF